MITLRELCECTMVTRRTIQGYECKQLLNASSKNKMGHLLYEDEAIEKVNLIRFYQSIGFALKEIKAFESMSDEEFIYTMNKKITKLKADSVLLEEKINMITTIVSGDIRDYIP